MREQKYTVTTSNCYGVSDFVVWVRPGETVEQAFNRQFPAPVLGGSDRHIINKQRVSK